MTRRNLILLALFLLALYVLAAITYLKPVPSPRHMIGVDYDGDRWMREHPDIVARARATVHASPTVCRN